MIVFVEISTIDPSSTTVELKAEQAKLLKKGWTPVGMMIVEKYYEMGYLTLHIAFKVVATADLALDKKGKT